MKYRYMFSHIPNDDEGQEFVKTLKKYLNKESYAVRVRGQYLKDEVKANGGWRRFHYGQPITHSKFMRVYIDEVL